jgi:hypothetical protein
VIHCGRTSGRRTAKSDGDEFHIGHFGHKGRQQAGATVFRGVMQSGSLVPLGALGSLTARFGYGASRRETAEQFGLSAKPASLPLGPMNAQVGRWRRAQGAGGVKGAMASRPAGCCLPDGFHKSALSAKYGLLPPGGIPTRLDGGAERLTLHNVKVWPQRGVS